MNVHSILKARRLLNSFTVILDNASKFSQKFDWRNNANFKRSSLPSYKEGSFNSRFHPPSAVECTEKMMRDLLANQRVQTVQQWTDIKNELMVQNDILSEENFSTVVMNCLMLINRVEEGHSFMSFLKEANIQINLVTYFKYMALCGKNVETCGQEVILDAFGKIKAYVDSVPVLDLKRAEHLIQGLAFTDRWRLCFDYVKKIPCTPNNEIRSCLAAAAIRNNEERLAWEIVTKQFRKEDCPKDFMYKEFLLHAIRLQSEDSRKSDIFISKVLQYVQYKAFVLNEEHIKLVNKYFSCSASDWRTSYTKLSRTGQCACCNRNLEITDLSDDDFECLRNSFFERSLKKSDLFINTTEREFHQYIKFIELRTPFHLVIDGLNTAHTLPKRKNPVLLAGHLLTVVEQLSGRYEKILILGKHHMKSWPRGLMAKLSRIATVFFTNDHSQDDPFMVYAALASGPHCRFLSMDLMRDHLARLNDPNLIRLFKRWQQTHQVFLNVDEKDNPKFTEPLRHSINIQGSMKEGWHIPFDDKFILEPYEELNNWLCVQHDI